MYTSCNLHARQFTFALHSPPNRPEQSAPALATQIFNPAFIICGPFCPFAETAWVYCVVYTIPRPRNSCDATSSARARARDDDCLSREPCPVRACVLSGRFLDRARYVSDSRVAGSGTYGPEQACASLRARKHQ